MIRAVAAFEFGQQLRSHVFWVVAAISLLMVFGSVTVDELRVGLHVDGARNGAEAVVETHLLWSLFSVFTTAALVGDAMLRDTVTGFAPLVAACPVRRRDVVLGRFLGAFAAAAACFLAVPLGLLLGGAAPWLPPASVGPTPWSAYPFALLVVALPDLLLSAALGFGLATATGAMSGALLGAVALLVAYGLGSAPGGGAAGALVEPFGFTAYRAAVAGWPAADRAADVPAAAGALLLNRALWLGVAASMVALACGRPVRARPVRRPAIPEAARPVRPALPLPRVDPAFGAATALRQLAVRTRLEVGRVVLTPAFLALTLLAAANAGAALWAATDPTRGAVGPGTAVATLVDAFRLVPIVVALFWAGELTWADREHGMGEIVAASPVSDAALALPRLFALALVLAALALAAVAMAALVWAARGIDPVGLGVLLTGFVLSACLDWSLFAALALFLQAVSPNKLAGWGWLVLYLIASLAAEKLGFTGPLYRYGRYPGWPLPPGLSGAGGVAAYRAYWTMAGVALTAGAVLLGGRGAGVPLRLRLRRLPARLGTAAGVVGLGALVAFAGIGCGLAGLLPTP